MPTLILDAVPMHEAASAVGINALMRSVGHDGGGGRDGGAADQLDHGLRRLRGADRGRFRLCFVVGAAAAFLGMLIAAAVPVARRLDEHRPGAGAATCTGRAAVTTR